MCTEGTINLHRHESWDVLHGIITNDLTAWIPCRETQRGPSTWRSTVVSRFGKRDINHMSYGTWRQVYNGYWSLRDECISLVKGDHGVSLILPFLRYTTLSSIAFDPHGLRTVTYLHSFMCMRATSCVQLNFFRRAWQFWCIQLQTVRGFDKTRYYRFNIYKTKSKKILNFW